MRARLIIAAILAQFAVLAWMAGEREWVLRTGRSVFLRTAPVDPRDPMRGDYVRFNYEISFVPWAQCRDGLLQWQGKGWPEQRRIKDHRVYALLKLDSARVAELVSLSDREPSEGTFLRGRVQSIDELGVSVRFGVEAMFTEQGKALALETAPQLREGVPLNIETAVSSGGLAVLKGYNWEPVGMTIEVRRGPLPEAQRLAAAGNERRLQTLTAMLPPTGALVTLKNHSTRPVALVVRPDGQSFKLVSDVRSPRVRWRPSVALPPVAMLRPEWVKVLQPGEVYREQIDFARPEWHLVRSEAVGATVLGPLPWSAVPENERSWIALRLEYRPPTPAEAKGLPHFDAMRFSPLRSRAIREGGVD